jgi:thiol:disulfide interchange protein
MERSTLNAGLATRKPTRLAALVCALSAAAAAFAQGGSPWGGDPFEVSVEAAAVADGQAEARVAVSFPERHILYAERFRVTAAGAGASVEPLETPQPEEKPDLVDPSVTVSVYAHPFQSRWRLRFADRSRAFLRVEYQGCDDKTCFMPQARTFRLDAAAARFVEAQEQPPAEVAAAPAAGGWLSGLRLTKSGGYLSEREFLAFLDRAEGREPSGAGGGGLGGFLADPVSFFRAHGLALTLVLVLVGGVLLNLTPCVLPMIPINLAIIGAGAGGRTQGFARGAAYGAGMVLVYGGTGWAILRSGLFFGALQASPWFSLAMALVFGALALALFDVYALDFARLGAGAGVAPRQSFWTALAAGGLSALLAGACVAPVVLAVLLLAGSLVASGSAWAQFLPFVLGLGMALPWPFAGAGLSVLPKPGAWMVRVKQAFGVFLVALACYYGYLAAVGFAPEAQAARAGSIAAGDRAAWEEKLAQAKREGKPVFVDVWATWCKNCSAMERGTFESERVKARLAGYVVVKVQAEKPDQSPAKEMLQALEVRGLPGFAVLK